MFRFLKDQIKRRLYREVGVSFNPHGVPFTLGRHLEGQSNLSVVDVGAYEGLFTSAIDRFCGVRRGILVEPQPEHAARLRVRFSAPRFEVVQAAVSETPGQREMEINGSDATSSLLKTMRDLPELAAVDVRAMATVACRVTTLDAVFRDSGLSHVDLLKLDVQGAEHLAIRGGKETLAHTTMVWTETSFKQLYEGSCKQDEVFDLLEAAGFSLFELEPGFRAPSGALLQADALFIKR
jgi:FkbM family methyltransferase